MPDYKKIFTDLIERKYPDKKTLCSSYLNKKELTQFDVMELTKIINHQNKHINKFNQKRKSYNHKSIQKILEYQKAYNLTDTETARHFKMSRNTIKKWKNLNLRNIS